MIDDDVRDQIKAYRAALDRVLLTGSVSKLRKFMKRHRTYGDQPMPNDETIETIMHKTITSSTTLPVEYRRLSKAWLEARNMHSNDDGDL